LSTATTVQRRRDAVIETFRRHQIATRAGTREDRRLHAMLDSSTYAFSDLSLATRVAVKQLAATVASRLA
jgi:hypothetical protein